MFARSFARPAVFSQASRFFAAPLIRDPGFNPNANIIARANEINSIEVTESNYYEIFDRDIKEPFLVQGVGSNTSPRRTLQIKNHVQTTHDRISLVHFDAEKSSVVGKRLKIGADQLAIVHRGIVLVKSNNINGERALHDFISKYAWLLNP